MRIITWLENIIFAIFQIFSVIFMYILHLALKPQVLRPKNMIVPRGTLILSNHQSKLDPWFVTNYLGFHNFFKLLPFRYPVAAVVFRTWKGPFIWCFGGYDIGFSGLERAKKLLLTRDLIHRKYTVLLFPEGKMVKSESEKADFQKGMSLLIKEDIPFLLVRIKGMDTLKFSKLRKNKISLSYSDVIQNIPNEDKTKLIQEFFTN